MTMRNAVFGLVLGVGLVLTPLMFAEGAQAGAVAAEVLPKDKAALVQHLKSHTTYPSTKKKMVASCNNMSDINETDRKWFATKLPDGEYRTLQDVLSALGLTE